MRARTSSNSSHVPSGSNRASAQTCRRARQRTISRGDEALSELISRLDALTEANDQKSLAFLTRPQRGLRGQLIAEFAARFGAPSPISFEFFSEDVLRRANAFSFGKEQLPSFDFGESRYVSFAPGQDPALALASEPPRDPYLSWANAPLERWSAQGPTVSIRLRGHEPVRFAVGGPSSCTLTTGGRKVRPVDVEGR